MDDRRADIVRKLQAKADSTTFPGERESLLAKVAELRQRYNLAADPEPAPSIPRVDEVEAWFRQWVERQAETTRIRFGGITVDVGGTGTTNVTYGRDGSIRVTFVTSTGFNRMG